MSTEQKPVALRRGTTGVCSKRICECEREGLGDQCIYLRPSDAALEKRTGEPHIDGWPLYSGLPPPVAEQKPVAFDHSIGADRYKVVRGSFWWHIRIGDSTADVGNFYSKLAAEDMALKLLTAFRDGAFTQYKNYAHPPQQHQAEPVGEVFTIEPLVPGGTVKYHATIYKPLPAGTKLYTHPPQKFNPLTDEQIRKMTARGDFLGTDIENVRAVERAHGITE